MDEDYSMVDFGEDDDINHEFPAKLTSSALVSGTYLYAWVQQRFDPTTGAYEDDDTGYSGDTSSGPFLVEINNTLVTTPAYVTARLRGIVNGDMFFEFDNSIQTSLTVKELDGSPAITPTTVLVFDQADGFVVSNPSAGVARVDLVLPPPTPPVLPTFTAITSMCITGSGITVTSSTIDPNTGEATESTCTLNPPTCCTADPTDCCADSPMFLDFTTEDDGSPVVCPQLIGLSGTASWDTGSSSYTFSVSGTGYSISGSIACSQFFEGDSFLTDASTTPATVWPPGFYWSFTGSIESDDCGISQAFAIPTYNNQRPGPQGCGDISIRALAPLSPGDPGFPGFGAFVILRFKEAPVFTGFGPDDEHIEDVIGGILTDSSTLDLTYNDGTPSISGSVITQDSITSDGSGLKLVGDSASPGNSKLYGTDGSGTKGWYTQPTGFTDELAQDAVGGILVDSSTIDLTYDDVGNTITAALISPVDPAHGGSGLTSFFGTGSPGVLSGQTGSIYFDISDTTNIQFYFRS